MNNLNNKQHPLYDTPTWMKDIELVSTLDNQELIDLKSALDNAELVLKENQTKKHNVLHRTLLNESELRVKRRALQMDQLDSEEQSLLLYAFQKEKDFQFGQNHELTLAFDKIKSEEDQLQSEITETHNALKSLSAKYSNRHKKEFSMDQIYERFKKDRKVKCFYSYASASHVDLLHGFLHVFEDEIIFESVIIVDKVIKMDIKEIVLVQKKSMYASPDRIDIHVKNGDVTTFFGLKTCRDEVAESIINSLALQNQE
jgi:hypothetical protein